MALARWAALAAETAQALVQPPAVRREAREQEAEVDRQLARFGERLAPRKEHLAYTLSYANRRRTEIARALAMQPALLLLDEPTAGMNPTETAEVLDYRALTDRWLPIVFAFVLGLSFVLLTVAFRSIVLAAVAIGLNLLSVPAAYGLIVLVFLHGVGRDFLGFTEVDVIAAWLPLFLFAVLFGLSMDYTVFLLSRIRERVAVGERTTDAVVHGVSSTARIITGAALIIIAVFVGFATGDQVEFQQMGFGVAVSLFIDATLVRLVLLPAVLALLGERTWYLPRRLAWLPHVEIEGAGQPTRTA